MASAAAVATSVSRSPLPDQEQDDILNTTGTITSADATLPDEIPPVEDDEEDADVARPVRRKPGPPISNGAQEDEDELLADEDEDADEELFGSEPDDATAIP